VATIKAGLEGNVFFTINKQIKAGEYRPVYKSECKKTVNGNFDFNPVFTDSDTIADDEQANTVMIHFYKYNSNGNHLSGASFSTTYKDIFNAGKGSNKSSVNLTPVKGNGSVTMSRIVIQKKESFLDYLFGGCEISLQIAVDFTASNGPPQNPSSLHYFDPNRN